MGAAPRGIHDDRRQLAGGAHGAQVFNQPRREILRFPASTQMMGKSSAAARYGHHLPAGAAQQPLRRRVSLRRQDGLSTAQNQSDAPTRRGGARARHDFGTRRGRMHGRKSQHRPQRRRTQRRAAQRGRYQGRNFEPQAQARGKGQYLRQCRAQQPIRQRPPVGALHMRAGMIDQVLVVNARRTGGHAPETG